MRTAKHCGTPRKAKLIWKRKSSVHVNCARHFRGNGLYPPLDRKQGWVNSQDDGACTTFQEMCHTIGRVPHQDIFRYKVEFTIRPDTGNICKGRYDLFGATLQNETSCLTRRCLVQSNTRDELGPWVQFDTTPTIFAMFNIRRSLGRDKARTERVRFRPL